MGLLVDEEEAGDGEEEEEEGDEEEDEEEEDVGVEDKDVTEWLLTNLTLAGFINVDRRRGSSARRCVSSRPRLRQEVEEVEGELLEDAPPCRKRHRPGEM